MGEGERLGRLARFLDGEVPRAARQTVGAPVAIMRRDPSKYEQEDHECQREVARAARDMEFDADPYLLRPTMSIGKAILLTQVRRHAMVSTRRSCAANRWSTSWSTGRVIWR